ncbi:MAG: GAF domain-containing protein [Anaerolineae bacterium]|nr:GAF domain-containing protein [Anaerolineae bacterium]
MFRRRLGTIRARLLLGFVVIALVPIFAVAVSLTVIGIYSGRQQATERLESVALAKETAIRAWMGSLQQQLAIVSATDASYYRIGVVVEFPERENLLHFYNTTIRNRLQEFVGRSPVLDGLSVIDLGGQVVLSTNPSVEGQDIADADYLRQGSEGAPFSVLAPDNPYLPVSSQRSVVTVVTAITDVEQQQLGVIVGWATVDRLDELLGERTGLGETGKAYLLNKDQTQLAGSLSGSDSTTGEPTSIAVAGVETALAGRANGTAVYDDYQGERVIGVFRWLPEIQATLFVEQDQSEAFRAIPTILGINFIVAVTALILAIALSVRIMRGIAKPVEDLAKTASQIAAGDLDRRAPVEREDEIGLLAGAFNIMTAQLQELIADLEQRVAERTSQLERAALHLATSAQVSREITSILAIDTLLAKVTELIATAFGYYAVHIYLLDADAQKLVFRASSHPTTPHDLVLDIDSVSLNNEAVRTNRELLAENVAQDPRFRADPNFPEIRSELVIPLRVGKRVIGTLDLLSTEPGAFKPDDTAIAQTLGDQIAIAIENARLYERSRELAVLEERNRLAREVHDAMNQSLYSIVLFAGAAQKEAEKAGLRSVQHPLSRVETMAQQALKEMRLMIYELRPHELEHKGLIGALQQRLEVVEERAGVGATLVVEGEFSLPLPIQDAMYRIIQEALNNSLKHSAATAVTVSMKDVAEQVEVRVTDNGVGFDLQGHVSDKGLGLATMRERADELGSELHIQSAPGEGTCVILRIPLGTGTRALTQEVPVWIQ